MIAKGCFDGFMWSFLRNCLNVVSQRVLFLMVLNWLFFGGMFVGALLGQYGFADSFGWLPVRDEVFQGEIGVSPWLVLVIFFFNLVLSGFVLVTLSGLAFFVLPLVFLSVRSFLWGALLNGLSTSMFLAAFPTLILEGEGYVLAALAGVNLGVSWFKPKWIYGEKELSRKESIKMALKDCLRIYVLVAIFLFVAAVVETVTIVFLH
jgi:hypothetical protein